MKKIALLAVIFISMFTSCSLDDGPNNPISFEVLPIDSVELPDFFVQGETYEIFVTYTKPNSCYHFHDFIYDINGHQRTVAVVTSVYSNEATNCEGEGEPEPVTVHFNFEVNGTETYVFKFYQGEDAETGEDLYYIVEVPVMDGRAVSESVVKD